MKKLWRNLTLRNKHLVFFGVIILAFVTLTTYVVYTATEYTDVFQENLDSYFTIHRFQKRLSENREHLTNFVRTGEPEELDAYGAGMPELRELLNRLEQELEPDYPAKFHMDAARYGLQAYDAAASRAVSERLAREPGDAGGRDYYLTYEWAVKISRYIDGYVDELFRLRLNEGSATYSVYRAQADRIPRTAALGVGSIAVLLVVFALFFSRTVTAPLHELALASRRMAAGELDPPAVIVPPGDEVGTLANSFNSMSENIRELVADLKDKHRLQRRLHEEELKNVSMERALREAQLIGLQTQINPHFLFNTLNAIARSASFEGADRSAGLIRSLSKVFRYLLRSPNSTVSLAAELQIVDEYMQIQTHRFGERLRYRLLCDLQAEEIEVPVLILQPLVENAVRYGVEPLEAGADVVVAATIRDGRLALSVADSGAGMSEETARALTIFHEADGNGSYGDDGGGQRDDPENTSGIGIHNVRHRLRLTYGGAERFTIRSAPGEGTVVEMLLPVTEAVSV